MKKKYVCIIPARGGSKTIKNKNIVLLNKRPLIFYTIKSAINSKVFDEIILSSDSNKVLEFANKYKITEHKRSKLNSSDTSSTHKAIKEILKNKNFNLEKKNIVILQPTSPFRTSKHIIEAVKKFDKDSNADSLVSVQECYHNMIPNNLMKLKKGYLKFNISKNIIRRQDEPIFFARNGAAIYITSFNKIKKYIVGGNILHYEMNKIESLDINDKFDLELANMISRFYKL